MNKITIAIRFFAMMREIVGSSRIILEFEEDLSIFEIINELANRLPDLKTILLNNKKINETLVFVLNGHSVELLTTTVKDNDELTILPPTGGG